MTDTETETLHDRPNILLSIDPEWAEAILEGEKKWEYRRTAPARTPPYRLVLYATFPEKEAIGEAYVGQVLNMGIPELVNATVDETPHERADIFEYFDGLDTGYAIRIDSAGPLDATHTLDDLRSMGLEPSQNFRYINTCDIPEGAVNV